MVPFKRQVNGLTGGAAELNALHPGVSYPRSAGQSLNDVNAAFQSGNAAVIISLATAPDNDDNRGGPLN